MKLTGRQRVFLSTFLDLYREAQEPLHYSAVARRLGVSKMTAYDMLRLLDERGLVQSEYVLRGEGQGAGRSSIVFRPTPQANSLFVELAGEVEESGEWEATKTRILEVLEAGKGYQDLLEEILSRLPQRQSSMLYATEMITAVILSLHQLPNQVSGFSGLHLRFRDLRMNHYNVPFLTTETE